jgi:hypothetical protein
VKIERLNALIFEAETQRDRGAMAWDRFLEGVLADDPACDARGQRRRPEERGSS